MSLGNEQRPRIELRLREDRRGRMSGEASWVLRSGALGTRVGRRIGSTKALAVRLRMPLLFGSWHAGDLYVGNRSLEMDAVAATPPFPFSQIRAHGNGS